MRQSPTPAPATAPAHPSAPLRGERSDAISALLSGGLAPLDFSLERWLDRLEDPR